MLLPPPHKCQKCAIEHIPELPHAQQSLYWQYWFFLQQDRWPTWIDAMEHCADEVRRKWSEVLKVNGVEI